MAVTQTQSKNDASVVQIVVGSYLDTGTAAAIVLTVGFQARYVKVMNEDGDCWEEWYEGMAAAEAMKVIADGTLAKITTNGITVAAKTFTIGLDTDINVTSEQLSWMVIG